MPRRFVVAYDGSPFSDKAVAKAVVLAQELGGEVILVTVLAPIWQFVTTDAPPVNPGVLKNIFDAKMTEAQKKAAEACREKGIPVRTECLEGHPVDTIIKYVKEQQAELLICGTRGLGGFQGMLLGSVAHKLVAYSPVSVLVVK